MLRRVNRLLEIVEPVTGEILGGAVGSVERAQYLGQPEWLRPDSANVEHLLDCLDADALTLALDEGDLVDAVRRGGKRGVIATGLTRKAAKRLRGRLLLAYSGAAALGVGVWSAVGTFGAEDGYEVEDVTGALHLLRKRVVRRWGAAAAFVWVREWHRNGRRHVNFVVFAEAGLDVEAVCDELGVMWLDVTGDGASERAHRELYGWWHQDARSSWQWAAYVTGEVSKGSQQTVPLGQRAGAAWNVVGGDLVNRCVAAATVRVSDWEPGELHARVVAADAALRPYGSGEWCVTQRAGGAWVSAVKSGDVSGLAPRRRYLELVAEAVASGDDEAVLRLATVGVGSSGA